MKENVLTITFAVNAKKNLLKKEDYKVIKCMEAQLKGEPMPYDVDELTTKRNAIREEINNLEQKISELKSQNAEARNKQKRSVEEIKKSFAEKFQLLKNK